MSIIIGLVTLISSYAVFGTKLENLSQRVDRQGSAISQLQTSNTDTLVALARIQTDIDYIKIQINKLVP